MNCVVWNNGSIIFEGSYEECESFVKQCVYHDWLNMRHSTYYIR